MQKKLLLRSLVSSLILVGFIIVVVTSVLLAAHIRPGGVRALHKWIGYAFMALGVIHTVLNFKALTTYFREKRIIVVAIASMAISAAIFLGGTKSDKRRPPRLPLQVFDTNGDGHIDADEIANAAASFRALDLDSDGVISPDELKRAR